MKNVADFCDAVDEVEVIIGTEAGVLQIATLSRDIAAYIIIRPIPRWTREAKRKVVFVFEGKDSA